MGWESSSIFQVLIVTGSTGSGVFVYSPTVGAGNLIASVTAVAGTDPYGNRYQSGVTSYSGAAFSALKGSQVQVSGGGVTEISAHMSAAAGVNTITSGGTTGADAQGNLQIESVAGGGTQQVLVPAPTLLKATGGANVTGGITADSEIINAALATGLGLQVNNSTTPASSPLMRIQTGGTGDGFMSGIVSGDTNPRISLTTTAAGLAQILFGSGTAAIDATIRRAAANLLSVLTADLDVGTVGRGLQVAEGTNAKQGTATLAGGTVTVSNTAVTANSRIFLTAQVTGVTGALRVSARTAGTSFTITSNVNTDAGLVAYEIFEPG